MRLVTPGKTDYSTIIYTYAPDGSALTAVTAGDYPDAGTIYYTLETDSGITQSFLEPTDLASAGAAHSDAGVYPLGDGANRLDVPDALLANPGTLRFYGEGDEIVVLGQPIVIGSPAYARLGAPAGASIAADLAVIDGVVDAVKAKTDNLPSSPAAVGSAMTLAANQDVRNVSGSIADKTGYALTGAYDAAKTAAAPGAEMALTSTARAALVAALEAEIADDSTGEAVKQAIIDKLIENLPDLDELTLAAIGQACRDAILDRVLAGNHTTSGTPGALLQRLDAAITSRSTFDPATQSVNVAHVGQEAIDAESFSQDAQTTLAAAIWGAVTRTITGGTVTTVSDKTGYSLATAPPTAVQVRTEIDSNSTQLATLIARLTAARAGYLDKLNVSGTLAHSDVANTYKADVSALALEATLTAIKGAGWTTQTLEAIADAIDAIEVGDGGGGLTAQQVRDAMKLSASGGDPAAGSIDAKLNATSTFNPSTDSVSTNHIGQEAIDAASFAQDALSSIASNVRTVVEGAGTKLSNVESKTANLPSAPAAVGSAMTLASGHGLALEASVAALNLAIEALNDYDGSDTSGVTSLLTRLTEARAEVLTKFDDMLAESGGVWRFTAQALENAPSPEVELTQDDINSMAESIADGLVLPAQQVRDAFTLPATSGAPALDAVLGQIKQRVDAIPTPGPGAIPVVLLVTTNDSTPVADAQVWVTTDEAGINVVAGPFLSNALGQVAFLLDGGVSYYRWVQKNGVNFTNPQEFTPVG